MHPFFVSTLGIVVLSLAFAVRAEPTDQIAIPAKVSANIMKRHPEARDIQANHEIHFGTQLLEVSYKNQAGEQVLELFTPQGHLFTNELPMESVNQMSPQAMEALKSAFPNYQLQKAELIGNPNGVGEEYEIYLNSGGTNWKVSISDKGAIQDKQRF